MAAELRKWAPGFPQHHISKVIDLAEFNSAKSGVFECRRGEKTTFAYKLGSKHYPCTEKFAVTLFGYLRAMKFDWFKALDLTRASLAA